MIRTPLLLLAFFASACASEPERRETIAATGPIQETDWRAKIAAASCPEDVSFLMGLEIPLQVEPVALSTDGNDGLGDDVRFLGGFHLTSPDARLGGLSGLDFTRSGNLVAVSDQGAFIWIGLDPDTLQPGTSARIGEMYGANGRYLSGKSNRDAEGLALTADGLALVSFERDHRVLGFDLEGCGAAARGVEIGAWSRKPEGIDGMHGSNRGAEGLAISETGNILISVEENDSNSPFGPLLDNGVPDLSGRIETPGLLSVTGSDMHDGWLYTVHRFYAPAVGNKIAIMRSELEDSAPTGLHMQLGFFEPPVTVDNFEGIAVREQADGSLLIAIVSDDNFSSSQRTLLFLFAMEQK